MRTEHKKSENSFQPFLYEADRTHIYRAELGESLRYLVGTDTISIRCHDNCFKVRTIPPDFKATSETIDIPQKNGIDNTDRIIILQNWLKSKGLTKKS